MLSPFSLCVQYDRGDAVSNTNTAYGAAQINDSFGIQDMSHRAQRIAARGDNTIESEKAIPNALGHLLYMSKHLRNCADESSDKACFYGWLGVMMIVGLSQLRGYKLTLHELDFSQARTKVELAYKNGFLQQKLLDSNNLKLYCLCKDDRPIALLDQAMMLCPFMYIDPDVMKDIPWYVPESSEERRIAFWKDPNELRDEKRGALRDNERRVLLWWFQQMFDFKGGSQTAPRGLTSAGEKAVQLLSNSASAHFTAPSDTASTRLPFSSNLPEARYPFAEHLFTVPNFSLTMPTAENIFSDVLLLVPGGKVGDPLIEGETEPRVVLEFSGKKYTYGIFLPFREWFAQFLVEHKNSVRITHFELMADEFEKNGTIHVLLEASVDGSNWNSSWTYRGSEQIYCCDSFFTNTLWPNFCAEDAGGNNPWNRYYVTLCEPTDRANYRHILQDYGKQNNNTIRMLDVQQSLFLWQNKAPASSICVEQSEDNSDKWQEGEPLTKHWHWKHTIYTRYPEYVSFALRQDIPVAREVGCLHLEPPRAVRVTNKEAVFAIDFGASNTICLAQIDGTEPKNNVTLHDGSDVRSLIRFCRCLGAPNEGADDETALDAKMFSDYYWYGPQTIGSQIRTIAQLYKYVKGAEPHDLRAPDNGRMIPTNADVVNHFINNAAKDDMLYSNIKLFGGENERNKRAAQLFLLHLELQCLLYALKEGANSARFIFSYPDDLCRSWLENIWRDNLNQLRGMKIISILQDDPITYQECMAAAVYINNSTQKPSGDVGYAIVDIGGGTTDISLWRKVASTPMNTAEVFVEPQSKGLAKRVSKAATQPSNDNSNALHLLQKGSVRYAGNKILAESVYLTCKTVTEQEFRSLWNLPAGQNKEWNQQNVNFEELYHTLHALRPMPDNAQQDEVAKIDAQKALIVNTFVDNFGFNPNINWDGNPSDRAVKQLRTLVRVKMLGLVYILSQYMRAVDAIAFTAEDTLSHYTIQLIGGGSRIMKLCGQEFCNQFMEMLLILDHGFDEEETRGRINIRPPFDLIKQEVAKGMLCGGEAESDGGKKQVRVDKNLCSVESNAKISDHSFVSRIMESYNQFVEYLAEDADDHGRYAEFGIYDRLGGEERPVYEILSAQRNGKSTANQQKIYNKFSPNFITLKETHLPVRVMPAAVAIYTINDMLTNELDR